MSKANTFDELNEMIDKAFEIIREGLESSDQYTRMRTALDLTQVLVIAGFSKRLESVERWAEEINDRSSESTKTDH